MSVNLAPPQTHQLKTALLFLVFNRLDTTKQVFEAIRLAKPPRLYVAADGARASREGEGAKVRAVRDYVMSHIDWPCEVKTLFREKNLGCKHAVSSAITWFFENEEMGVILEDDCLPDPTFFRFCEELLAHYCHDERIAMITGDNFQLGRKRTEASYYFSRYNHIWGWASWRRAWKHYDPDVRMWPKMRDENWLDVLIKDPKERKSWEKIYQALYEGQIDTWDYQWILASWCQGMLSIIPTVNLVSNIGFGADATHTQGEGPHSCLPVEPMVFPLQHPSIILQNQEADAFTARSMVDASFGRRVWQKLKRVLARRAR